MGSNENSVCGSARTSVHRLIMSDTGDYENDIICDGKDDYMAGRRGRG